MNEIEMGVRIPVDNSDDIVDTLDNLVKEGVIADYEISGDVGNFPEITIEFSDFSVIAHHEMRPQYPNDLEQPKGLHITRSFKYNRTYGQGEFVDIADQLKLLDDIRDRLNEAKSVDVISYIDRVIS